VRRGRLESRTPRNRVRVRVAAIVLLDKRWARNQTPKEIEEYIESRLSSSLGFRAERIEKIRVTVVDEEAPAKAKSD